MHIQFRIPETVLIGFQVDAIKNHNEDKKLKFYVFAIALEIHAFNRIRL